MTDPAPATDKDTLLRQLLLEKYEPIAVVGIGLKFPGDNVTPDGFADFLRAGRDAVTPVPGDRWDTEALYSPERGTKGKISTTGGGFVSGIDRFDAKFFNISPKEAAFLDPQHRMVLEAAWHALESANVDPGALRGGSGGVYMGISSVDYSVEIDALPPEELDAHAGTGTAHSAVSGRLSYFLGWRGPCMSIDTACSSSLVAMHLAAKGLRQRECDIALAGGVNAIHHPRNHIVFSQANMLAPDGRCKTFDESADGYSRSEGVGVIVLKRLSDAKRDGDRILALLRGSSVRQDGESGGLTVPNGIAQAAVMRAALADGMLEPGDIGYVEAHGTGTSLGDPIEMGAVNTVFGASRSKDAPLVVGSVKTNVGHMEAAAGAAGVVKAILQVRDGVIYPHLGVVNPNTQIPWDEYPVTVPADCRPWVDDTRRAIVNSFGFAGTIASVVLEQPPWTDRPQAAVPDGVEPEAVPDGVRPLLTLSAKTPAALRLQAAAWREALDALPEDGLADFCRTSNIGRGHFAVRVAAPVADAVSARAVLDKAAGTADKAAGAADQAAGTADQDARPADDGLRGAPVAFLFTGQGAQYAGMGRQLYERYPLFREHVDRLDELFAQHLGRSVRALMFGEAEGAQEDIHQTHYTQCALFTLEYSLARLWMHWGVQPSVLLGHSIGEIVAATVAGLFTPQDAVRLVAARGRLMQSVSAPGGMVAVQATAADVAPLIEGYEDVSFAAVNAPEQCVISGGDASLDRIGQVLQERGLKTKRLAVSHAFHSPLMSEIFEAFRKEIQDIAFHEPTISFVSNVTGRIAEYAEVATPDYWVRHIAEPVAFAAGVECVQARGRHVFLEVGPSGALAAMGRRSPDAGSHLWLASLVPTDTDGATIVSALAKCYVTGLTVDWAAYHQGRPGRLLDLPPYAFDRRRYWLPGGVRPRFRGQAAASEATGLLGRECTTEAQRAAGVREFRSLLSPGSPAYLVDHVVMGQVVFPGAGYVELAFALADAVFGETVRPVRDLRIHEPLFLTEDASTELRTRLLPGEGGQPAVEIVSLVPGGDGGIERRHATAVLGPVPSGEPALAAVGEALTALADTTAPATGERRGEDLYAEFTDVGLAYGPEFQRVLRATAHPDGFAQGVVRGLDGADLSLLHPAVLDCAMQTLAVVAPAGRTFLPVGFDEIALHKKPRGELRTLLRLSADNDDDLTADIVALEGDRPSFTVRGLRLKRVANTATPRQLVHAPHWTKKSLPAARVAGEREVLVVGRAPDRLPADAAGVRLRFAADAAQAAGLLRQSPRITDLYWFWTPGQQPTPGQSPGADVASLHSESEHNYRDLLALASALEQAGPGGAPRLVLVTEAAQRLPKDPVPGPASPEGLAAASVWGFGQVLFNEYPSLRVTLADLPADAGEPDLLALLDECTAVDDGDHRIAFRRGVRYVQRLRPVTGDEADDGANFELSITEFGQFSNVKPVPVADADPLGDEITVQVRAAGLNFKDVLNALGMLRQHALDTGTEYVPLPLGFEAAGTVLAAGPDAEFAPGDDVLVSYLGCMRRRMTVSSAAVVRKPAAVGFTEAAGLPTAYVTAYHALHGLAGIRPGDRVLVHAAAGGVGQAAVQLARLAGAEVYATASPRKWPLLRAQGIRHVMNSRTLDFADQVLEATGGRGVDIVLNSLNKEHIPASVRCLADGGRFVELGKIGIWSPERMREERPDVAYHNFDLSEFPEAELNRLNKSTLETVVRLMDAGDLGPLPTVGYGLDEIEEAFGVLSRGANTGKLVLEFPAASASSSTTAASSSALSTAEPARQPVRLSPDRTYLITGGLGALGLTAARRLVREGARHLALVSRRAVADAETAQLAAELGPDVRLTVLRGDIAEADDVARIVAGLQAGQAPLGGVLHAAGVLADAPVSGQSWESIDTVLRAKMYGSWLLHRATAELPGLSFFVGYSSVASVLGSMGQSNYAAGNAFLDRLMHERAARGLPGLSVNWGPWAEVGMAAELSARQIRSIEDRGIKMLAPAEGMRQLLRAWDRPDAQAVVCEFDWERFLTGQASKDAFYTAVRPRSGVDETAFDLDELLARPRAERATAVGEVLRAKVAAVLHFESPEDVEPDAKFIELGLDSLAAVELKNALESAFRTALPTSALFDYPTVGALSDHLADLLAPPDDAPDAPRGPEADARDLTDEEADAELAALRQDTL